MFVQKQVKWKFVSGIPQKPLRSIALLPGYLYYFISLCAISSHYSVALKGLSVVSYILRDQVFSILVCHLSLVLVKKGVAKWMRFIA